MRKRSADARGVGSSTNPKAATMGLMVLGAAVSYKMQTVAGGWDMVVNIGAGTGAVYLLRWLRLAIISSAQKMARFALCLGLKRDRGLGQELFCGAQGSL